MAKKKITTVTTTTTTTVEDVAPVTTLINKVVDMSGSMLNVWDATIEGLNEYDNGHKELANCDTSLTVFDDVVETRYVAVPISEAPRVTQETYKPRGMTALRDAIGRSIRAVEALPKQYDRVLFVIMTDGGENSSREYSQSTLNALIQEKRKAGWEFVFLGANQDAWQTGSSMGINNNYNYQSTTIGSKNLFTNLTRSSVSYAATASAGVNSVGARVVSGITADSAFSDLSNLPVDNVLDNNV